MLPLLSRGVIDRAGHRRTDEAWLAAAWRSSRVLVMDTDGRVPVSGGALRYLDPAEAPAGERWFLGQDADGTPYFAVHADVGPSSSTLRELALDLSDADAELVSTALALVNWHASHIYSPVTGTRAVTTHAGWVRAPEGGGPSMFPRTDPAMIVLVTDGGDRCLLARGAGRPATWYSCLAGFVEPGESAEACVAREVQEEVGLAVGDITYVVSQPWPFPGSLMLGFYAVADPEAPIQRDPGEIAEARWFTRDELREALEGRSPHMATPGAISVAHHLMHGWAYREG